MWFRGVPVGAYMRSSGRANGQQRSAHANCEDDVFVQAVVYSFARRSFGSISTSAQMAECVVYERCITHTHAIESAHEPVTAN